MPLNVILLKDVLNSVFFVLFVKKECGLLKDEDFLQWKLPHLFVLQKGEKSLDFVIRMNFYLHLLRELSGKSRSKINPT